MRSSVTLISFERGRDTVTDPNKDGKLVCNVKYDGKESLTIVNTRRSEIPPTGDDTSMQGLILSLLLSLGMMMVTVTGMLRLRKREQED